MRSILSGLVLAMVAVVLTSPGPVSAQPTSFPITVNTNGAAAVDVTVMLNFANGGKQPQGTTGANGNFVLDLANMPKVRVEVTIEDCPNGTQVVFNEPGAMPEDGCNRRVIGFWIWGNGTNLTIDTGAGTLQVFGDTFFTPLNVGLIGGGGAAAVIIGVTAGGGDSSGTSGTSSGGGTTTPGGGTPPPSGGGGTPPPSTSPTDFNTQGSGSLSAQTNQCGFNNSANISFTLNVNANGTGTWTKTHTNAGQTFMFTVSLDVQNSSTADFDATITNQNVAGQQYQVTDQVTVIRNGANRTLEITQTFRNNGNGCEVIYRGSANGAPLP